MNEDEIADFLKGLSVNYWEDRLYFATNLNRKEREEHVKLRDRAYARRKELNDQKYYHSKSEVGEDL